MTGAAGAARAPVFAGQRGLVADPAVVDGLLGDLTSDHRHDLASAFPVVRRSSRCAAG